MPKITTACLEKIKGLVDIYDVVSPYVSLKKCGANWRGLSPFNQEKTPSFFVMPTKNMFRCFSSGNAGDIFRFIQLKENVSFAESIEIIANRFHIALEYEKSDKFIKKSFSRKSLFEINEMACSLFEQNFYKNDDIGKKVRQYWTEQRNFSLDVAKENGIGFAGHDSKTLIQILIKKNFSFEAIKASGLFFFKENETDLRRFGVRFHSRLTIPIRDIQRRVVGFSARFLDGITPQNDLADAKYINSPETEIFHKGQLLFGLDRARQYIDTEKIFWLVEGQFDAIRCWTNGLNTAIAPQGTAITDAQLAILRRYSPNLHCMLDGDSAGIKAAQRILPMAISAGLDVKFFVLPDQQDPDSYFSNNFDSKFQKLQNLGMSGMQFLAKALITDSMSATEKVEAITRIFEIISQSESSIVQEGYLSELAQTANLAPHALMQDFKSFLTKRKFSATSLIHGHPKPKVPAKLSSAESQLLSVVITDDSIAAQVVQFLEQSFLQNLSSIEGKLLLKILYEFKEHMWEGIATFDNTEIFSDIEKNLVYNLSADMDDDLDKKFVANVCLKKLHENFIKNEIEQVDDKIRKISLDEIDAMRILQESRLNLRKNLTHPPQIS